MTIALNGIFHDKYYEINQVLSNLTLTFGFYDPGAYMVGGGWSIGNEIVFYAFLPVLIILSRKPLAFFSALSFLFCIYCYFAFFLIPESVSSGSWWKTYINPLNQIFLFGSGVALAWAYKLLGAPKNIISGVVLIISVLVLVFFPVDGKQAYLTIGIARLAFTFACIGICFGCINCKVSVSNKITSIFKFFGDVSYSLYLLHFVTYYYVKTFIFQAMNIQASIEKAVVLFGFSMPLSIFISYIVYKHVEKPFIKLAKKITTPKGQASKMSKYA